MTTRNCPPVPDGDQFPAAMLQACRWVRWRYETRGEKLTKIPVQLNGQLARANDPSTWATFEAAREAARRSGDGLGFMLGAGFVGVDLSHVRDLGTGRIEAWAETILGKRPSYTEISPSGTGIHIIGRGVLPPPDPV